MNSRATFASTLVLASVLAASAVALAADAAEGAAPPAAAPASPAAATPAPAAVPAPSPASDGADDDAAEQRAPKKSADSDAAPAVPPPDTSPPVILAAHELPAAPPAAERPEPNLDDGKMGTHQEHWFASIGYRLAFVGNSALDPFSENDSVPQVSISAGRTLFTSGPWSFAALALWDWGSLESTARGAKSNLTLNRITLGAEGRYHFFRRLYVFGRLAPGALSQSATLRDSVTGGEQTSASWVFAGDVSAGANFEFAGENRGESKRPRAWVGFDGGYGFASSSNLTFKPADEAAAPVRTQPQNFGELAVRGGFLRMTLSGSY